MSAGHRLRRPCLFGGLVLGMALRCPASAPVARLSASANGDIEAAGWSQVPAASSFVPVAGPITGIEAFRSAAPQRLELRWPVANAGTLAFWFHLDRRYGNGPGAPANRLTLLRAPGAFDVSLTGAASSQTLTVEWRGKPGDIADNNIRMIVPELPGPDWYHLAIAWDGRGRMGAWLDGTAYFLPGGHVPQWQPGRATALELLPRGPPLAQIQLWDRALSDGEVRDLVPPSFRGRADRLLGSVDLGPLVEVREEEFLASFPFATAAELVGWHAEGPLIANIQDGWLEMKSRRPGGPNGHTVFWCPLTLPESFVATWDFRVMSPTGLCIVFFSAHAPGRDSIFASGLRPRTGVFGQYTNGDIATYHISYFAATPWEPRSMANLRKDPGFYLLANGPIRVTPDANRTYHATIVKDEGHIRMAIDGRLIIDYDDRGDRFGAAYESGQFGLRQMQWTQARYRNLRFFSLGNAP